MPCVLQKTETCGPRTPRAPRAHIILPTGRGTYYVSWPAVLTRHRRVIERQSVSGAKGSRRMHVRCSNIGGRLGGLDHILCDELWKGISKETQMLSLGNNQGPCVEAVCIDRRIEDGLLTCKLHSQVWIWYVSLVSCWAILPLPHRHHPLQAAKVTSPSMFRRPWYAARRDPCCRPSRQSVQPQAKNSN